MRVYVVCCECESNFQANILPSLVDNAELCKFSDSYTAFRDIRYHGKPCAVFVHHSKIPINGTDFVSLIRDHCPYVYLFVVCDGKLDHHAMKNLFSVTEEQIVCDNCESRSIELAPKAILQRLDLISKLTEVVDEVKTRLDTIQERANTWVAKIWTSSS